MRVPVIDTVKKTYNTVFGDYKTTFGATWIMLVALTVISLVPMVLVGNPPPENTSGFDTLKNIIIGLAALLAQAVVAARFVRVYNRQLLLGEGRGETITLAFGEGEKQVLKTILAFLGLFIAYCVACAVIIYPVSLLQIGAVTFALIGGAVILAFYASGRFTFLLPLAAMDDATPIKSSWMLTKDQAWALFGGAFVAVLLFTLAATIIQFIIGFILSFLPTGLLVFLLSIIKAGVNSVAYLIMLTYSAYAYQSLKGA